MSEYRLLDKLNKALDDANEIGDVNEIKMNHKTLMLMDIDMRRFEQLNYGVNFAAKSHKPITSYCGVHISEDNSLDVGCFEFEYRIKYPERESTQRTGISIDFSKTMRVKATANTYGLSKGFIRLDIEIIMAVDDEIHDSLILMTSKTGEPFTSVLLKL